MATKQELRTRLTEAERAYHDLSVHGAVRTLVDQSGERIEYSPTNSIRLRAYILDLKRQLGILVNEGGPLGFYF